MNKYQIKIALKEIVIKNKKNENCNKIIKEFQKIVSDFNHIQIKMKKNKNYFPELILNELIYHPRLYNLKNENVVQNWIEKLVEKLNKKDKNNTIYTSKIKRNENDSIFEPSIKLSRYANHTQYDLKNDFLESKEYFLITNLGEKFKKFQENENFIEKGEKIYKINDIKNTLEWLIKETKRGFFVQRYKGLGEMNPDQLWNTTMNPETRNMLQVTIKDAISANNLFNTLMGDLVEPRRKFIQKNALKAENIDI